MIVGMTTSTFTLVHVSISLVGIASGLVVVFGLLTGKRADRWTALFLASTAATSATGFGFPVVPEGTARIRVQMSAAIEEEHMERALSAFEQVGRDLELI